MILENHFLVDHREQTRREAPTNALKNQLKAQRSGFELERRGNGADGVFGEAGNGRSAVCPDEVKLIRAQGECLGIRSR